MFLRREAGDVEGDVRIGDAEPERRPDGDPVRAKARTPSRWAWTSAAVMSDSSILGARGEDDSIEVLRSLWLLALLARRRGDAV